MATLDVWLADLEAAFTSLETRLATEIPSLQGEERRQAIRSADNDIDEAEELIERAELETKNCPKDERARQLKRVRAAQNKLDLVQQKLNRARHTGFELGGESDEEAHDEDDSRDPSRQRLLLNQARLENSSARLQNAQLVAGETESIGVAVLDDLNSQRDTILRVRGELDEADAGLSRSRRTLRAMAMRAFTSKIMWYMILAALVMILVLIVYVALH